MPRNGARVPPRRAARRHTTSIFAVATSRTGAGRRRSRAPSSTTSARSPATPRLRRHGPASRADRAAIPRSRPSPRPAARCCDSNASPRRGRSWSARSAARDATVPNWRSLRSSTPSPEGARSRSASLDSLARAGDPTRIPFAVLALVPARRGARDRAIALLDAGVAHHTIEAETMVIEPEYDALRDDPRYRSLLARAGLADVVPSRGR